MFNHVRNLNRLSDLVHCSKTVIWISRGQINFWKSASLSQGTSCLHTNTLFYVWTLLLGTTSGNPVQGTLNGPLTMAHGENPSAFAHDRPLSAVDDQTFLIGSCDNCNSRHVLKFLGFFFIFLSLCFSSVIFLVMIRAFSLIKISSRFFQILTSLTNDYVIFWVRKWLIIDFFGELMIRWE